MATEIIDLTKDDSLDCPPSSPMPASSADVRMNPSFGVVAIANHNLHPMIHPHQTAQWQAPHTYVPSLVAPRFYPCIHVGQVTTVLERVLESNIFFFPDGVVLEPVLESNTFSFPNGVGPREPWTQREHELFMMGVFEFGHGRWSEIASHFVWSRTPQQVEIYAANFFGHQAATYLCGSMIMNPPTGYFVSNGNHMISNRNLVDASASYSMPMIVANEAPLEPITLFPENAAPFPQVSPCGGESSSNNITYGGGPSTSMTATDDGEIDLELRLG